ncbi:LCP family protein [Luteimicrobium subarcticum]|uniref:LytR family transcriptional attenuator n=1 Tax=Luteimicrobium subarcticum TaxID=620910 RepID=A0A2M8WTN6_9MICO|nr:LCP family protein [Luteimicrobium subarcticum]PJI94236.1 LytR family transcriptional attenuator [Luteimicrobium subarcticum]
MPEKTTDKRPPRHLRGLRSHGIARGIGIAVVAVLACVSGGAYGLARHFQGNVDTQNVDFLKQGSKKADPKDAAAGKSLNILILGSDWRGGTNSSIVKDGAKQGDTARSDTTMVMHISADRKRIDFVSIPRDSLVDIPRCQLDSKGATIASAHTNDMFNNAFAYGWDTAKSLGWSDSKSFGAGAACTWKTVESLTGIAIDDYVVVDFSGFDGVVDALGGVDVCVPQAIDDPRASHLVLSAGWQTLKGKTAISWARTRHGIADGSDIARIGRQQALVGAISNKFFAQNYVTDSPRLLKFVDAVTKSMHTSSDLGSFSFLLGLGFSMRHLDTSNVTFRTVPWHYDVTDPNRVDWTTDQAAAMWDKIAHDEPIGDIATKKTTKASSGGTKTSTSTPKAASTPKATKKASTPKKVVTGSENSPLSAGDLPTTAAQCDAAIKAAQG